MSLLFQLKILDNLDLKATNLAIGKHAKENKDHISKVVSDVIVYLQNSFSLEEVASVSPFIEKMKLIDKQFEEAGAGTTFATAIYALSLIYKLRSNLHPERQNIVRDPFILKLKELAEASEIENKADVAQKLYNFQKNVLLPALGSVETLRELQALESIFDDCNILKEKVSSVDINTKYLENLQHAMISIWNFQTYKLNPLYSFLLTYEKGDLNGLDSEKAREGIVQKLNGFVILFGNIVDNCDVSQEEKIGFYNAINLINQEFEAYEDRRMDPVLQNLSAILRIPKGIQSTFPIELESLIKHPITNKSATVAELYAFQEDVLLPALQKASTEEELFALERLVDQCAVVKDKISSRDEKDALEKSGLAIRELWNVKLIQTNQLYSFLLNYKKDQINFENDERTKTAENLNYFIPEFIKISSHSSVSQNDKIAIYRCILGIYEEFAKFGEEKLIEPALKDLCVGVDLSIQEVKSNEMQNKEDVRKEIFFRIQSNISRLNLKSSRLRKEIGEVLIDIGKLKDLDLSGLEEALKALIDPTFLKSSQEENRFIENLLLKCSNQETIESDLRDYLNGEDLSIERGRQFLLSSLKGNMTSLESLVQASNAKEAAKDLAIKERFDAFVKIHPSLNLAAHFSNNFPILVRNFEGFTREIVIPELENRWQAIIQVYDNKTEGKFSELLQHYSYLNPRELFDDLIEIVQKKYFDRLNLSKITTTELLIFLEKVANSFKNYPGKLLQVNYNEMFFEEHYWLLDNIKHIKVPFNQLDDTHENLGKGVCYNNSLMRISLIDDNPIIPSQSIKMGSTSKTRYFQSKLIAYYAEAQKEKISFLAAYEEQVKIAEKYGLQQLENPILDTSKKKDPHLFLVEEMARVAFEGNTQFIVYLSKADQAHALNVQIDHKNHVYRFFDDNLGICEYKTLSGFKDQVSKYFRHFYPEYYVFQFRFFKKI